MRKSLLALCIVGGLAAAPGTASAHAPGTVVDWSGLYVGLHAGYAWSDVDVELREPGGAVALLEGLGAPTGARHNLDGFLGGGHIGIQHQWGRWVLGVEAALSIGDQRDRSTAAFSGTDTDFPFETEWEGQSSFRTEIDNFASIAGRLGYAHDRWLVYAKGGLATAAIKTRGTVDGEACFEIFNFPLGCSDFGGSFSSRERHYGWLAGGGLEYMITPNLIVGVEYSYTDLGARTHTGSGTIELDGATFSGETRVRVDPDAIHAVTARVSIKLGRDEPAPRPMK